MKIAFRRWKLTRRVVTLRTAFIASAALLVLTGLLVVGWILLPKPPLLDGIAFSRQVFDRYHKRLRVTLTNDEKYRVFTPLSQIAPELVRATLVQEDRYYNRHPGINPVAIGRSAWNLLSHGKAHAGASTITMQLARMRFRLHTRTIGGKLVQIFRALQLERHYSKSQILEAYFNLASYGRNIEGVGAASILYFGKAPSQLTFPEAVALSVIPQSPTRRALHRDRDNPALTAAQNRLFDLVAPGSGGKAFRARALSAPPFFAPHFTRQVLREREGEREIVTTLDLELQQLLERHVRNYLAANRERGFFNAAAMLVDSRTMETLAKVGSAGFFDDAIHGQIDGTRSKRSPGSTLKPFVYALAMDRGLIHPLSILADAPQSFAGYNPENFDREFVGPIRASDALARSRNIPAVSLASQLSHPDLYEMLKTAGVDLPREKKHYGLTLPLGGAEVTMQDLVRLYGALANGGKIRPIRDTLPYRAEPGVRMVSPEAAFLTLEMLGNDGPASYGIREAHEPVYWKTGTSNGFHDAWTAALFGQYLVAVWVGNFDGHGNPAFVGRTCAAPLAFQIIDALRGSGRIRWTTRLPPPGANLRRVEFCAVSGQLPLARCNDRVSGWFIPGITPISTCSVHREVLVDEATGLRVAVDDGTRTLRKEVYEFWPSDLQELFTRAGLPRRSPPPFLPGYGPESNGTNAANLVKGKALAIVSPKAGLFYVVRAGDDESRGLTLKAETETDVAQVYWFAGKQFLGISRRLESLNWRPAAGHYTVTALDDHGRSASVAVTIQSANGQ